MFNRNSSSRLPFNVALGVMTLALAGSASDSARAQFAQPGEDSTLEQPTENAALACGPGVVLNNVNIFPGGPGDDEVTGTVDPDDLSGGPCNDTLFGAQGDDVVEGNGGDDELHGEGNADIVRGGFGHDLVDGGIGNDVVIGGPGHDECLGGSGNDLVIGGPGVDTVNGNAGCDFCAGDSSDTFIGCEVIIIAGVVVQGQLSDCADTADPVSFLED